MILQKTVFDLGCLHCTLKEMKYLCVIKTTPIPRLDEILHTQKS